MPARVGEEFLLRVTGRDWKGRPFCAGAIVRVGPIGGVIVEAAPILRRYVERHGSMARSFVRRVRIVYGFEVEVRGPC